MSTLTVYVGLDYHKDSVQVCVLSPQGEQLGNRRCANDVLAVMRFAERHGMVKRTAIESCPGAADFAEELVQNGWSVDLAHPGYVARMKQSPDKSDYTDARLLADLTRVGYLPKVWLAPHAVRELRRLVRYRQQLVNERRAIKLRITATLREQRIEEPDGFGRWTKSWFHWFNACEELSPVSRWVADRQVARLESLNDEIAAAMRELKQITANDVIVERLLELPGIGPVTAYVLRAEIGRFDRFTTGKQLSRFCGLSPRNASSGNRQADAGLIKQSNPMLRSTVIEAAQRLKRYDPRWKAFAGRLSAAGKPASVVAAAVANRWMRWVYHRVCEVTSSCTTSI